jgi:hypothetical protein
MTNSQPEPVAPTTQSNYWFPIVTLVIGSVLTLSSGIASQAYQQRFSTQESRFEREQQEKAAREEFQRRNLLELQDTMFNVVSTAEDLSYKSILQSEKTGKWRSSVYTDRKLLIAFNKNVRKARVLNVRIKDDRLRNAAEEFVVAAGRYVLAASREDNDKLRSIAYNGFYTANGRAGELLRSS